MIFVACLDEKERAKELKATASRFDRAGDYEGFGKSFHTAGVGAWLCCSGLKTTPAGESTGAAPTQGRDAGTLQRYWDATP